MRRLAAATILVAAIVTLYAGSTRGYFFDDDFHWLAQSQSFALANVFDLSRYDHFYRPIIELYFFVGLSLFGCAPLSFHLTSIAIHLATTAVVYRFARELSSLWWFGWLSALFFAVQPGLTDAVTWIGAITDQLPVLWFVLTLVLHLWYRRRGGAARYLATLLVFAVCHLTHESAATLLPMMALTDLTFVTSGGLRERVRGTMRRWRSYVPFTAVLVAFLAIAYVVNTRSYLVQEGFYAFGWHAVPNILNYILWLYVGQRRLLDYVATVAVLAALVVWGTPRMRYSIAWIVVTLLPVSFFTWDNAPRYLYLPAVGFALLVADLIIALNAGARTRLTPRLAGALTVAVVALLAGRFAVFAKRAADSFPARTLAYERFVTELRRANPEATSGGTVFIDQRYLEGVPELYREPAARVGLCLPDLRLEMR
jgi:hypothetical protein